MGAVASREADERRVHAAAEHVKVLNMPDIRRRMIARGIEPAPLTLAEFAALWKADMDKYAAIVKKANSTLE